MFGITHFFSRNGVGNYLQIIRKMGQILSKISNIAAKKVQKMTCAKLFKLMSFFAARALMQTTQTPTKKQNIYKKKNRCYCKIIFSVLVNCGRSMTCLQLMPDDDYYDVVLVVEEVVLVLVFLVVLVVVLVDLVVVPLVLVRVVLITTVPVVMLVVLPVHCVIVVRGVVVLVDVLVVLVVQLVLVVLVVLV